MLCPAVPDDNQKKTREQRRGFFALSKFSADSRINLNNNNGAYLEHDKIIMGSLH